MIKQPSANKKLKRFSMFAAAVTLGVGLLTTLSAYDSWDDEIIDEDDGTGAYWESSGSMYVASTLDGSGSSGSCWATTRVFCSETVTVISSSGGTGGFPDGSVNASKTVDKDGNSSYGLGATINLGSLFKKKNRQASEQRTTKYRADCESGGKSGCQPANCEGASVGAYKDC